MPVSEANQRLFAAINSQKIPDMRTALEEGADINCRDEKGNTPLHRAVMKHNPEAVKLLLKPEFKREAKQEVKQEVKHESKSHSATVPVIGAKTHRINHNFETPLQYAMSQAELRKAANSKEESVIGLLLRHRTAINASELDERLGFCLAYYQEGAAHIIENRALLDYAVSHLTGINIQELRTEENLVKYESHIRSIKGEKKDAGGVNKPIKLEGFNQELFLPLRIRNLFEILLKIELGVTADKDLPQLPNSTTASAENRAAICKLLIQELLVELETLHIRQSVIAVKTSKNLSKLPLQLARNIADRLQALPIGEELSFAGGWIGHAVYTTFVRHERGIIVRNDNLGVGCSRPYPSTSVSSAKRFHPEDKERRTSKQAKSFTYLYPAVVGSAPLSTFNSNQPTLPYLEGLIKTKAFVEDKETALSAIYDAAATLPPLIPQAIGYPSAKEQGVGNCVAKNHQIGLQIRLRTKELYRWVRRQESHHINPKEDITKEPFLLEGLQYPFCYWKKENKPRPASISLTALFVSHYQGLTFNNLFDDHKMSFQHSYIPLELERTVTLFKLKEQDEKEVKETKNGPGKKPAAAAQEDNTAEPVHVKRPVLLENLFKRVPDEKDTAPLNRIVISGVAGMGKTTSCQYILRQWANQQLWKEEFTDVIYIRLRHLSSDRYPKTAEKAAYTLAEILQREYETFFPIKRAVAERAIVAPEKTLWLVDGYDEIASAIPPQLKAAIDQLLKMPHLLLTSRPETVSALSMDARVELMGFSDPNVTRYIDTVFEATPTSDVARGSAALMGFIKTHDELFEIAHTPVLLEILCKLWRDPSVIPEDITGLTALYQNMRLWLLRRASSKCGEEGLTSEELEASYQKEFEFLEHLAFQGIDHHTSRLTSAISKESMRNVYGEPSVRNPAPWRDSFKKVLSLHLLRDVGGSHSNNALLDHDCEFIHLTFQEFCAAQFLLKSLQNPHHENYSRAVAWIAKYKYDPFCQRTLSFLAGLLSNTKREKAQAPLQAFWQALESEPRDQVGPRHLLLITRCLEAGQCDPRIPHLAVMMNYILQSVRTHVSKSKESEGIVKMLDDQWLPLLRRSSSLLKQPLLQDMVLSELKQGNKGQENMLRWVNSVGAAVATPAVSLALVERLSDKSSRAMGISVEHVLRKLGACAATPAVLSTLVEQLSDKDREVRSSAAEVLVKLGASAATPAVLSTLVKQLSDKDERVRSSAAEVLGNLGASAATPAVLSALVERFSDKEVRFSALWALGKMGVSAATPSVVSALVERLSDKDRGMRYWAAEVLGKLGASAATPAVLSTLVKLHGDNSEEYRNVGNAAAEALGNLGACAATPAVLTALVEQLYNKNMFVRLSAEGILKKLSASAAVPAVLSALIERLNNEDGRVISAAAIVLGKLGVSAATPTVLSALVVRLSDKNICVRLAAAEALGKLGASAATPAVLSTLAEWLSDEEDSWTNNWSRGTAAAALGNLGASAATPAVLSALSALVERLSDEDSSVLRYSAAAALWKLGASVVAVPAILPMLIKRHNDKDYELREEARKVLRDLGASAATPALLSALVEWLNDKDKKVRYEAVVTLGKLGVSAGTPAVLLALVERLSDDSDGYPDVRDEAAKVLGKLGGSAAVPAVLPVLVERLSDKDNEVKYEATIIALGTLGASAAAPAVLSALVERLSDKDERVKILAGCALAKLGASAATPAVLSALVERLSDKDERVKILAVWALVNLDAATATPTVLSVLVEGLHDGNLDIRETSHLTLKHLPFCLHVFLKNHLHNPNPAFSNAIVTLALLKNYIITFTSTGFQIYQDQSSEFVAVTAAERPAALQLLQAFYRQAKGYGLPVVEPPTSWPASSVMSDKMASIFDEKPFTHPSSKVEVSGRFFESKSLAGTGGGADVFPSSSPKPATAPSASALELNAAPAIRKFPSGRKICEGLSDYMRYIFFSPVKEQDTSQKLQSKIKVLIHELYPGDDGADRTLKHRYLQCASEAETVQALQAFLEELESKKSKTVGALLV